MTIDRLNDTLSSMAAAALIAAAGLLALPTTAAAESPSERGLSQWKACLDGAQPTTHNAEPADAETLRQIRNGTYEAEFGRTVVDINPDGDQVVLDFRDGLTDAEVKEFGRTHGLDVRLNSRYSAAPNVYIADVAEGAVPYIKDCLANRDATGSLQSVEENVQYQMLGQAPNDPLYQFQWNFRQIGVADAWETTAGEGVTVAVADTGVAFDEDKDRGITRPKDLEETARTQGYDFVDDDDFAWDGHGHGTHVAGTIAQTTNNGYGVAGVAHKSEIMPLRVLNSSGFGDMADIADSIRYAADNGAEVINMSLGGPLPSLVMKRAINYAHSKGMTVVAAAGNGGKRAPSYPAAFKHVIAVAATQYDKTTTFYSQWGDYVDIAAPGGNTKVDQNDDGRPDGVMQQTLKDGDTSEHDFVLYMGTSMASPHAAAGAALVISQGITNPSEVERILQESSDDSQSDRFDDQNEYRERYGSGIMQAAAAVKQANLEPGGVRFAGGLLLIALAAFGVRRKDILGMRPSAGPLLVGSTVMVSSGLFFLPGLLGDAGLGCGLVASLAHPLAELDMTLLGADFHQNPLLASALLPLGAYALLGGRAAGRKLAAGIALGMSAFCLTEVYLMTSDVRWIPGMAGLVDQAWLLVNGLASFAIGYLGLKRR